MTRYACIVADPPWPFSNRYAKTNGAARHYSTMGVTAICALRPPAMADTYLFLWRVSSMQEEALAVVRAWGFVPKSEIVWLKRTKFGNRHFGMGRHVRLEHEVCLVATRGSPKPLRRDVRSTFESSVGRHSEKPAAFFAIVESLCGGPRLEMFARDRRPGWDAHGDELGGVAIVGGPWGP